MKHTNSGAFWPLATGVGCCQQDRQAVPVGTPYPRRRRTVDNIVIFGEATVRVRGSAGAGEVCQRRGDSMWRVWGAERGGAVPNRA